MNIRSGLRGLLLAGLLLVAGLSATAQTTGGQICVRSFEDRNGSGLQDAGEPFISGGISVTLADAAGIIIQSALLEDSPRFSQGIVCFQGLSAGQYTIGVTSAEYRATTTTSFVTSVAENSVAVLFDFGGQRIVTALPTPPRAPGELSLTPGQQRELAERLFFSTIAAVVAAAFMTVIGAIIYFLFYRVPPKARRYATGQYPAIPPGTGPMPATRATGQYPAPHPATGPMPAMRPGTGPMPAVRPGTGPMPAVQPPAPEVYAPYTPPTYPPAEFTPLAPLDDTGPNAAVRLDEPPINPDDTDARFRPPPS